MMAAALLRLQVGARFGGEGDGESQGANDVFEVESDCIVRRWSTHGDGYILSTYAPVHLSVLLTCMCVSVCGVIKACDSYRQSLSKARAYTDGMS